MRGRGARAGGTDSGRERPEANYGTLEGIQWLIPGAWVGRRSLAPRIEENVTYPLVDSSIRMHRFDTIRSSCRYVQGKRLWLGKATLTATAVKITGWRGLRRYVRRVLLDDMQSVSRRADSAHSNISFRLMDGSIWSVNVTAPGMWRIETAQRIRALHPDRAGDGDEMVMNVSTWPPADEPVSAHGEAPPAPMSDEGQVEEPPAAAPPPPAAAPPPADLPVVEEWLDGPRSIIPSAMPEPDIEVPDLVDPSYSLKEAYLSAAGTRESDSEAPWKESDAGQTAYPSILDLKPAPEWRPVHVIVSGAHSGTGWKSIHDLDSHGLARG